MGATGTHHATAVHRRATTTASPINRMHTSAGCCGKSSRGQRIAGADRVGRSPLLDHLVLNELETTALAGAGAIDFAADQMRADLPQGAALVVKCGAQGAKAWRGDERCECDAPVVPVVDTVGAGDVFNAGYLFALQQGRSLGEALRFGVETASRAISTSPRRYEAAP